MNCSSLREMQSELSVLYQDVFIFNNQAVLILLLLVETVCAIDLLSFNKILWCT